MSEISASAVKELRDKTGAGMMDCKRALADAGGNLEKAGEFLRERGLAKAMKREGRATTEGAIGMVLDPSVGGLVELACETDFVAKTEEFQSLATQLARAVASDPSLSTPEALLAASIDGATGEQLIRDSVGKLGENIVVKRVARLDAEGRGCVGGYVHAGRKLGVILALRTEIPGDRVAALAKDLAMHVAAADPAPVAVDHTGLSREFLDRERALFRRQAEQEGRPAKVIDRIVEGRIAKLYQEICLLEQPFVKDPDRTVGKLLDAARSQLGGEITVLAFARFKLGEVAQA